MYGFRTQYQKQQGLLRANRVLKNAQSYDQPLQIELNEMKGEEQAQPDIHIDNLKDQVYVRPVEHVFPKGSVGNDEELRIPTSTIYSEAEKPGMYYIIGNLPQMVYHDNKFMMNHYKKYKDLAVVILLFVWQMVNLHLILQPTDEVAFRLWEDPWVMFFLGAGLASVAYITSTKDDFSLSVLKLTVEHAVMDEDKFMSYLCTSSQMPKHRFMKLIGAKNPQEVATRMNQIVERMTMDGGETRFTERRERDRVADSTTIIKNLTRGENAFDPITADVEKKRIERNQTVIMASLVGAVFLAALWIYARYIGV